MPVGAREAAALLHSLVESAKLAGPEPAGSLAEATHNPGAVTLARDLPTV
jgi:hypothetical protein